MEIVCVVLVMPRQYVYMVLSSFDGQLSGVGGWAAGVKINIGSEGFTHICVQNLSDTHVIYDFTTRGSMHVAIIKLELISIVWW